MCEEINEFDICPYTDAEAVEALGKLADHPAVLEVSKVIFPDKEPEFLRTVLKSVRSIDEFQILVMNKAVEWVLSTTAHNFSYDGIAIRGCHQHTASGNQFIWIDSEKLTDLHGFLTKRYLL